VGEREQGRGGTKGGPFAACFLLQSSLRDLFFVVSLRLRRTACCVVNHFSLSAGRVLAPRDKNRALEESKEYHGWGAVAVAAVQ